MNHWTQYDGDPSDPRTDNVKETRYAVSKRPKIINGKYHPSCVIRFTYSLSTAQQLLDILGDDYFIDVY